MKDGMKITQLEAFPANANPFHHDLYNMGEKLAQNVMIMFDVFPKDKMEYLIVVNTETGERIRIDFPE